MSAIAIMPLDRVELAFAPRPWPFAHERRAAIDAHFAALRSANPALWNGRVLMLYDHAVSGSVLRGACLETDFASMLAWRNWDFPDPGVKNCFAMGVLRARDGAFLLGVMGAHTANAGKVYFPAGLPDPSDIAGAQVDLGGNVMREVAEETGLRPGDFEADPGWVAVFAGPRIALMKLLAAREDAEALRRRILAHLGREAEPELADIRIARGPADLDPMMPPFVAAFLEHAWSGRAAAGIPVTRRGSTRRP
jgi:8-oxo-dGTP pyrophosphatase MutT (NUDIX family)